MTPGDSDPDLVAAIAAEIARAGGAIPFARFMELALYHPERGHYRRSRLAPGRGGADFLTAPETHPIFGRAIGRQIREVHERLGGPPDFAIREYGAGRGALAAAIRDEVGRDLRYEAIELNEQARAQLLQLGVIAHAEAPGTTVRGAIVANEFLDALPVHRVVTRRGRLREVQVGWDGARFVDVEAAPSTPALAARLDGEGIVLAEGQRAEIALGIDDWVAEVGRTLVGGIALIVDYGHPAATLYSARHGAGTLLGYAGHRVVDDPYANVGHQDLTAHVDFTALERAAERVGLTVLGRTTQAEFLVGVGAEELVERVRSDPGTRLEDWLALRSALGRLLDPRHTGAFRVLVLGRGLDAEPQLRGLAYRLPQPPAPAAPGEGAR